MFLCSFPVRGREASQCLRMPDSKELSAKQQADKQVAGQSEEPKNPENPETPEKPEKVGEAPPKEESKVEQEHDDASFEAVAQLLRSFTAHGSRRSKPLPLLLRGVIATIAHTGESVHRWEAVRVLIEIELLNILEAYQQDGKGHMPLVDGEAFGVRYARVKLSLSALPHEPFTMQRLCELLHEPRKYYSNMHKFFHSISKCLCGITEPNNPVDDYEYDEDEDRRHSNVLMAEPSVPEETTTPDTAMSSSSSDFSVATSAPWASTTLNATQANKKAKSFDGTTANHTAPPPDMDDEGT